MAEPPVVATAADSHGPAKKPRPKRALPQTADLPPKPLPLRPEVPLHVRPVLNGYREVAALGICPERTLRRLVAIGRVQKCIIRLGRHLRFVRDVLIAELTAVGE